MPHSPVTESDAGQHLNLRAPGGVAIELCALAPAFLAALEVDGAMAGSH